MFSVKALMYLVQVICRLKVPPIFRKTLVKVDGSLVSKEIEAVYNFCGDFGLAKLKL